MKQNLREADFSKFKKLNGDLIIKVTKRYFKLVLRKYIKFKKIFNYICIVYELKKNLTIYVLK